MKKKEIINYLIKELEVILLFSFSEHENILTGYGEWCLIIFSQLLDKYLIDRNYTFKKPNLDQLKKLDLKESNLSAANQSNSPLIKSSAMGASIKEKKGGKYKFDKTKIIQQLDKLDTNKLDSDFEYFTKLIVKNQKFNDENDKTNNKNVEDENKKKALLDQINNIDFEIFRNKEESKDSKYKYFNVLRTECNNFNSKFTNKKGNNINISNNTSTIFDIGDFHKSPNHKIKLKVNSNSSMLLNKTTSSLKNSFCTFKQDGLNIFNPVLEYVEFQNVFIQSIKEKEKRIFKSDNLSNINDTVQNLNTLNKKITEKSKSLNQIKANVKCLEHSISDKNEKINVFSNKINSIDPAIVENKNDIKQKINKLSKDILNISLVSALKLVKLNSFYIYTSNDINNVIRENQEDLFDEEI